MQSDSVGFAPDGMKKLIKDIDRKMNWKMLTELADWVVEEGVRVQQIPAPTFAEDKRAAYIAELFQSFGLTDISIDAAYNVYGRCIGLDRSIPALMVSAHTDTVFDAETDLSTRRDGNFIYGPGLGDNSLGVSGLLGLARMIHIQDITPACDIWFVATSCEEGLGDLKGMRAAVDQLKDEIGMVINLEGLAFGHIYHAGIAVHRFHITAEADGGHSWLHFGRPSAVHSIVTLAAQITQIRTPQTPRTTYNIGMIEGGEAINAIGRNAGLWLDMRSESQGELEKLINHVRSLVQKLESPGLSFNIRTVGDRPSGSLSTSHPLVQGALAALECVNLRGALETGSTDANIPLYLGIPAVTIGITRGGNAHRLDEYIETTPVASGMRQLILLVLGSSEYQISQRHAMTGD